MMITSITPAIKVVKENNMMGIDMYIGSGDKIKVIDLDGNETIGEFLFVEWGVDEEEDDVLILELANGEQKEIGMSWIEDIDTI